jgi:hypothetical protein
LLLPGLSGRLGLPLGLPGLMGSLLRMTLAGAACGLAAAWLEEALAGALGSLVALGLAMGAGAVVYAGLARALGVPEWEAFAARIRRRGPVAGSGGGGGSA